MRVTTHELRAMKARGEAIAMVTAYDATAALIVDRVGIPAILVGDSLGQAVLGHDTTIPVTIEDMVRATAAVVRGTERALIVGDLPFMTYQVDAPTALRNAARLLQEGGAQAVKVEGGRAVAPTVKALTDAGVAVMGHIGLTPQSLHQIGGYRVQGRSEAAAAALAEDALALQEAGVFAIVLELVPTEVAGSVTERLDVPTIGIGAGPLCDGQIQVLHDVLGMLPDFKPRHARRYAEVAEIMLDALGRYASDVREKRFPSDAESFPAGGKKRRSRG